MSHGYVARTGLAGALALLLAACASSGSNTTEETATVSQGQTTDGATQAGGEWRSLFDGRTTSGWRAYRGQTMPDGWRAVDGALTRVGEGGDIVTTDQFGDFELELEWKVNAAGNSGVFYRATEATEAIYENAPEMQVLDDAGHRDGQSPLTSAGAVYGLYAAPRGIVRPAGEWNTARIVARGPDVEHWLNGTRVAAYVQGSPEWARLVSEAKFREWPSYGKAMRGHIGLQDHGDWAAFRNIRIRELR